jgi:hypothetical protein
MRSAAIARCNRDRKRCIAALFQLLARSVDPSRSARSNVFDDDPFGAKLANDSAALVEKAALRTAEASSLASGAEVLTGTAKADDVDGGEVVGSGFENVIEPFGVGPMSGEHGSTVGL